MPGEIWTIAEDRDGTLPKSTLEALGKAREIGDATGGSVALVLLGEDIEKLGTEAAPYGADILYLIEHDELAAYRTEPFAKAAADLASQRNPDTILLAATSQGRDLGPRLAARLKAGMASECIAVDADSGGALTFTRPIFAGKALEKVSIPEAKPQIATLRPKVFPVPEANPSRQTEVVRISPEIPADAIGTAIKETIQTSAGRIELTEADIIVSGGRGMKGPEHFQVLEELADTLGAAVGASRAAVDSGWRDHQDQVGQTGKTVTPTLYIACGISGAIQHLAGMSSAKCIVAINKDSEAPIFKVADYGIVGDLFEVLPALKDECKKSSGS